MEATFSECTVDGDVVSVVGKFVIAMADLKDLLARDRYSHESLPQVITGIVAEKIAHEYLATHKMEITNSVNLKEITDAVQLKIIEGFSLHAT